jgi:hypothetical protein
MSSFVENLLAMMLFGLIVAYMTQKILDARRGRTPNP